MWCSRQQQLHCTAAHRRSLRRTAGVMCTQQQHHTVLHHTSTDVGLGGTASAVSTLRHGWHSGCSCAHRRNGSWLLSSSLDLKKSSRRQSDCFTCCIPCGCCTCCRGGRCSSAAAAAVCAASELAGCWGVLFRCVLLLRRLRCCWGAAAGRFMMAADVCCCRDPGHCLMNTLDRGEVSGGDAVCGWCGLCVADVVRRVMGG